MSILSEMLREEYERLLETILSFERVVSELPKGAVSVKRIGGRAYQYLQWREGGKVKSKYVKAENVAELSEKISRRKYYEGELKAMRRSKKEFERALGKEL